MKKKLQPISNSRDVNQDQISTFGTPRNPPEIFKKLDNIKGGNFFSKYCNSCPLLVNKNVF